MSKTETKSEKKYVYGPPVCKECGTKVFEMTNKHYICVMCRNKERKQKR